MKKIILIFLFFLTTLFSETSIWKVQKNQKVVYIGGTIHILRTSDYPLPKEYDKVYSLSEKIYFEASISGINDAKIQKVLISKMALKKNQTLSGLLSKNTYEKLEKYCNLNSLDIKQFENFKPVLPILMLTVAELRKMGVNTQGVDHYYEEKALSDGKILGSLESLEEQIGFISSMGEGNEDSFVLNSLKDIKNTQMFYSKIIISWRNGDIKSLNKLFVEEMRENYPRLYKKIIVDRNNNWLPIIKKMFNDNQREFILVGLGHLIGKDGVLELLKNDGYTVEKFK